MEDKNQAKFSGRVITEGDELYYEVRGHGEPLILIPGAGGDADLYSSVAEILSDEYKVITYDRRANSRSTMNYPQNFEICQQSRDVVAVLHAVGETSAFVFGNSSGAVIAMDMAKTQPQAIRAIVVHEPPLARMHPKSKKWMRFCSTVYWMAFRFGPLTMLWFLVETGLPIRPMIKIANYHKGDKNQDLRISQNVSTDFLLKQEMLPVNNGLCA